MLSKPHRDRPRPAATLFGTVMLLDDTGDLAADLADAIEAAGGDELCPHPPAALARCIAHERMVAGLQAEAGTGGLFTLILHSHTETFTNGARVGRWLTFSQTEVGDAVYWNVGAIRTLVLPLCFANLRAADDMLRALRVVAGKPTATYDNPIDVPEETSPEDL